MSWKLKYLTLLLVCGFCDADFVQKCFTLNKIKKSDGSYDYSWETRLTTVQIDVHCPNGFISLSKMVFSIPNYENHFCISEDCQIDSRGYTKCDCCKRQSYSSECSLNSPNDVQQNVHCNTRQACNLSIGMVDLSEHCERQISYPCDPGYCKSRWVEVHYKCVKGMNNKFFL